MQKNVTGKSSTLTIVYLCRNDVSPWICHDAVFSAADLERTPRSRDVIKCVAYLKSTLNDRYCSNVTNDLYGALIFYYLAILEVNVNKISTFSNTRLCRIKFGKITH